MTIRTILVDDEKLAIQGLQLRLDKFPDVEIIETCANGREAIRKIKTEKPDLVFLDIQMPGFDGFSVVKGVMEIDPPLFVFVTAYEEHAIRAFEANAINYYLQVEEQADRLEPRVFQRVHRSTIVNLDQVRQVKPHTNGECFLVLDSGSQVKVSRSYRDVVARFVH